MSHLSYNRILHTRNDSSMSRRSLKFDLYKNDNSIYFLSYKIDLEKLLNYKLIEKGYKLSYIINNNNIIINHYEKYALHTNIIKPVYLIKKVEKLKKVKKVKKLKYIITFD